MNEVQNPGEAAATALEGLAEAFRRALIEAPVELLPGLQFAAKVATQTAAEYRRRYGL